MIAHTEIVFNKPTKRKIEGKQAFEIRFVNMMNENTISLF